MNLEWAPPVDVTRQSHDEKENLFLLKKREIAVLMASGIVILGVLLH